MFSWKSVRTTCLVLLLLPIIHLVYLVAEDTYALLDASPNAWADEIEAYVRIDGKNHLPENPIVVVGGKRVKLWQGLEDLLAPRPVLMRGLGDAIVDDLVYNYQRLIGYYRPDTVVLLPSHSEFHIRDNKSPEDLYKGIRALVSLDASHGITRRFYIFTPLKTPLHPGDDRTIVQATDLLKAWADRDERVNVLDANALLANGDGRPNPGYYRSDGINLNERGYLRLSMLLQEKFESENVTR